jgi:broad specificity phosphatase PhoE
MRAIYIRHADKSYGNINNMEYFKHDPGITEMGVERAKCIAKKLIEIYGEPTQIVSSPYRRTRETSLVMNSVLKNPLEDIIIDIGISEYLGNHSNAVLDVTSATKVHSPPHPETFENMKNRVKKHLKKIQKYSKGVIWFISHGLIIKQLAGLLNIKTSKQLPYLTCFSFIERENVIRAEFVLFRDIVEENEIEVVEVKRNDNEVKRNDSEVKRNDTEVKRNDTEVKRNDWTTRNDVKKFERVLIPPISPSTGRDDLSGRTQRSRYF